jgi:choline monooxygenase
VFDHAAACAEVPLTQAHALDVGFYTNPHWHGVETGALRRGWQLIGHAGDLAEPGDHIVADVAGASVIVVRQADGGVAGFHNVCRHRAGPLLACSGRGATRLRCQYHGWTYGLDGRLRAAPEMAGAEDFVTAEIALAPVQVRLFQGLVFAALDPDTDFDAVIAGIADRIAPIDMAEMRFDRRIVYDVDADWKVYIDNYLEGYHVPHVHPTLLPMLDYGEYHTDLGGWWSLQHSPVKNSGDIYGDGPMFYYFIWPNTMLNILPGRLQTNRVVPRGPGRCSVDFDFYYTPDAQHRAAADQAVTDTVQAEDASICAAVQRNLMSGGYTAGRLSPRREAGVWQFHNWLRRTYAASAAR